MSNHDPAKPFNVLFVCEGNDGRSIMAEAILNRLGAGRFRAFSAGSAPVDAVDPHTINLLKRLDYDVSALETKDWDEFSPDTNPDAPSLDFVFTVCDEAAGEVCPAWSGRPMTSHWSIQDPALVGGSDAAVAEAFDEAYRQLNIRISAFANLPFATLDAMSLQGRLDKISAD